MAKYLGYYSIGGGQSYNREGYEYSNLREARKSMREMAEGTCPQGSTGRWWIENLAGETVAEGQVK